MASEPQQSSLYPYATPDEPRQLSDEDLIFLSRYTGEKDLEKLRQHVLNIWKTVKAKLWVYACIQRMMFLQPRITKHYYYPKALAALKENTNMDILDIGCCFGQDTRQLILDGVPRQSIISTDITPDYWNFGKDLFNDRHTLGVREAFGSFTDPGFIGPGGPLGHLRGRVAFAWAGAVLHVLSAEEVRAFAKNVLAVMSRDGIWFGTCVGMEPAGEWEQTPSGNGKRYLHSPASLEALLLEVGFTQVSVEGAVSENLPSEMARMQAGGQKVMLTYAAQR